MNEKEFNTMFDKAFEKVVSEVDIDTVPDYTTAWGKTRVQMRNQRVRKNRIKKIQIASGIAGMILLGSVVFSLPVVSDALSPMMARIAETRDQIVDVFTKDDETFEDGMKTTPPPDDAGVVIPKSKTDTSSSRFDNNGINEKWTSLEDYKANINGFPLKDINYIPENYVFSEVRLFSSNTVIFTRFKFINSLGTPLSLKAELSKNIQDPVVPLDTENYKYEEKTLQNGSVAKLFLFDNGDIKVHVFVDHLSLELFGEVPKEKAIQFMEGLIIEQK